MKRPGQHTGISRARRWAWGCMVLGVTFTPACKDADPPPTYPRDLSDNGSLLLPTKSAKHIPGIKSGQAEWHAFRDPSEAPPKPADDKGSGQAGGTVDDDLAATIREVVANFNSFVEDDDIETLVTFYVAAQAEQVQPFLEAAIALKAKIDELEQALIASAPDQSERIAETMKALRKTASLSIAIDDITVQSESEVTVTLPPRSIPSHLKLRLLEEDGEELWYFEIPDLSSLVAMQPTIDASLATFDGMIQNVQSGQTNAEAILNALEQMLNSIAPAGQGSESTAEDAGQNNEADAQPAPDEEEGEE